VHAKDILAALRSRPGQTIRVIMRPPLFVPGTREVEDVLADMKRLKTHLAIVLDEYGGTAGVVTMEDLLEEIVGEILDEYDEPPEAPEREGPDIVVVAGSTHISELNERFGLSVPDEDYTTIGGFVFGALGRLPVVGDRVTAGNALFTVREMDGRRIESLAIDLHAAGDRRAAVRAAAGCTPNDALSNERCVSRCAPRAASPRSCWMDRRCHGRRCRARCRDRASSVGRASRA
jgi:CBS domain containing-hemolysin-like protein